MRKIGALLLCLLVGFSLSGRADDIAAEVLPLPEAVGGQLITIGEEDPLIGPHPECYAFRQGTNIAASYADPSVTVSIGYGRYEATDYMYARVRIADASQMRTLMAAPLNSQRQAPGPSLAKRARAVLAVNGDFCGGIDGGTVIRQGEVLRLSSRGNRDVLLVDKSGDFHILEKAVDEDILAFGDQAMHAFTFGPALIVDGEPRYGYRDSDMSTHRAAQRTAICQTGPLTYLIMTSAGPENTGNRGLKLDQFVTLLTTVAPDIINAYNLDGGSSATLIFRKGKTVNGSWSKINVRSMKPRELKDIIYFADAWMPEEEGGTTD